MDQTTITQDLKDYLTRLSKFVSIDEAYLFGSSSTGTAKDGSDIDILILSRDFSKYDPDTPSKNHLSSQQRLPIRSARLRCDPGRIRFSLTPYHPRSH